VAPSSYSSYQRLFLKKSSQRCMHHPRIRTSRPSTTPKFLNLLTPFCSAFLHVMATSQLNGRCVYPTNDNKRQLLINTDFLGQNREPMADWCFLGQIRWLVRLHWNNGRWTGIHCNCCDEHPRPPRYHLRSSRLQDHIPDFGQCQ
jgi:hypothetical protein